MQLEVQLCTHCQMKLFLFISMSDLETGLNGLIWSQMLISAIRYHHLVTICHTHQLCIALVLFQQTHSITILMTMEFCHCQVIHRMLPPLWLKSQQLQWPKHWRSSGTCRNPRLPSSRADTQLMLNWYLDLGVWISYPTYRTASWITNLPSNS